MEDPFHMVTPLPRRAVAARLRAVLALPWETAIDDAMNYRSAPGPGEPLLIGTVQGDVVSAWRRGRFGLDGMSRFDGQLIETEGGTQLSGSIRTRGVARLLLIGNLLIVGLQFAIVLILVGWGIVATVTPLWAGAALVAGRAFVNDRTRLAIALGYALDEPPPDA